MRKVNLLAILLLLISTSVFAQRVDINARIIGFKHAWDCNNDGVIGNNPDPRFKVWVGYNGGNDVQVTGGPGQLCTGVYGADGVMCPNFNPGAIQMPLLNAITANTLNVWMESWEEDESGTFTCPGNNCAPNGCWINGDDVWTPKREITDGINYWNSTPCGDTTYFGQFDQGRFLSLWGRGGSQGLGGSFNGNDPNSASYGINQLKVSWNFADAPIILIQPDDASQGGPVRQICQGQSVTLSATVNNFRGWSMARWFRWEESLNGTSGWTTVSNQPSHNLLQTTFNFTPTVAPGQTRYYRVRFSAECLRDYTTALTVNSNVVQVTVVPANDNFCKAPACDILYVDPCNGDDGVGNNGSQELPYRTISRAMLANPTYVRVAACASGTDASIVNLINNVVVEGGYVRSGSSGEIWTKSSNVADKTIITFSGVETLGTDRRNLVAFKSEGRSGWAVSDIEVRTANASGTAPNGNGTNNYGFLIRNSSNYNIVRCDVKVGNASNGLTAIAGWQGSNTFDGTPTDPMDGNRGEDAEQGGTSQQPGCDCIASNCEGSLGGSGGFRGRGGFSPVSEGQAGGFGGGGGNGGEGYYGVANVGGFPGLPGGERTVRCSGGAGSGGAATGTSGCPNGNDGGDGLSCDVTPAAGANGAAGTAAFSGGYFVPGRGADGVRGLGGGGGSRSNLSCDSDGGRGGMGGGGGGGGGGAGQGGGGGGGSFAIYRFSSATGVVLTDVNLSVGLAGAASIGGEGGAGGSGAGGRAAMEPGCGANEGGRGGASGAGTNGAKGGNGGAGAAGLAILYVADAATQPNPSVTIPYPANFARIDVHSNRNDNVGRTCINSEIDLQKIGGTWNLGSGVSLVNDLGPASTSQSLSDNNVKVTVDNTGFYNIGTGASPAEQLNGFLYVVPDSRTLPVMNVIGDVTNDSVCTEEIITFAIVSGSYQPANILERDFRLYTTDPNDPLVQENASSIQSPSLETPGVYIARYQELHNCCGWSRPVYRLITVVEQPGKLLASDFESCDNESVELSVSGITGTVQWFSDPEMTNLVFTGNPFTTPVLTDNTTYWVNQVVGTACASPEITVSVTVFGVPNPTVLADRTEICIGEFTTLYTEGSGGDISWYADIDGNTLLAEGSEYITPVLTETTTYYVRELSVKGCLSEMVPITVTVFDQPGDPSPGPGASVCAGSSASLTATGSGGTITWYADPGGFVEIGTGSPFNTPIVNENTSFWVAVSAGAGCRSNLIEVQVEANTDLPDPDAAGDDICAGETASLTASGVGTILRWYSDDQGINEIGTGSPFVTAPLFSNTSFWVRDTDAGCPSDLVEVLVNVRGSDPLGDGDEICSGKTATISATSTGGTLYWYSDPDGDDLVGTGSPFITGVLTSTTSFWVQEDDGEGCVSGLVEVLVIVSPSSIVAPDAEGDEICEGETATLTATGSGGTLNWYSDAGGTTLVGTGSPFITDPLFTNTSFWVQEDEDGCTSDLVQADVIVNAAPPAPSGSASTSSGYLIDEGFEDITNLSGWVTTNNSSPLGITNWFQPNVSFTAFDGPDYSYIAANYNNTSGVGTISNWLILPELTLKNGDEFSFYARSVNSSFPDRLQVRLSDNGSSTDVGATATSVGDFTTLLLDINPTYTVGGFANAWTLHTITISGLGGPTQGRIAFRYFVENAGPFGDNSDYIGIDRVQYLSNGEPLCAGETAELTATGSGGTFNWYSDAGGTTLVGTGSPFITDPLTETTSFWLQEVGENDCPSELVEVVVEISPLPDAPDAEGDEICEGETATLTATGSGGTLTWYSDASGTTVVGTGSPFTTDPLTETTSFWVSETVGLCESELTEVAVTVNELPEGPDAEGDEICEGETATLTAIGSGGTLNWYSDAGGITLVGTGSPFVTDPLFANTSFWVQEGDGDCASALVQVDVIVNAGPPAPVPSSSTSSTLTLIDEGFEVVPPAGWVTSNNSVALGVIGWFQGNSGVFSAFDGPTTSYAAANFNSAAGLGTISNWMILPELTLKNGDEFSFYTRTVNFPAFPDRLQVRLSEAGSSTNVGATATSVGDFTTLLLDINPTYSTVGYPNAWTQYTITISGLGGPTQGRIAFRYFVENAGPSGSNSDYIGIDRVRYVTESSVVCEGESVELTATGSGGTYNWYSDAAGTMLVGTGTPFFTDPLTETTSFWLQEVGENDCPSELVEIVIDVTAKPDAPEAEDVEICFGETASLTATGSGGTLFWYSDASGTTLVGTGSPFITPVLFETTSFWVQEADAENCKSDLVEVVVTVIDLPQEPSPTGDRICPGETATLTVTGGGGTFTWYADAAGTIVLGTGPEFTTDPLFETTIFYVSETVGNCESNLAEAIVIVDVFAVPISGTSNTTPELLIIEGFDEISNLPGWDAINRSVPLGVTNWFQGNSAVFPSFNGAPTSYIAANFNNASGLGTISNWLIMPELILNNGDELSFYARSVNSIFPDRLQVRLSEAGPSTDVGATATSVGDFSTLLLDINPTYTPGGFANAWTQYTISISGLSGPTPGRIAFRYFVESAGPAGANSDYIGIDDVQYFAQGNPLCAGQPATLVATGSGGTYNWYSDPGATELVGTGSPFITDPIFESTSFWLQEESESGCLSDIVEVPVLVVEVPEAPEAEGDSICPEEVATLTATGSGGELAWFSDAEGNTQVGSGDTYITPPLSETTSYWVGEISEFGCLGELTEVEAFVKPLSIPEVEDAIICAGETAILTVEGGSSEARWYSDEDLSNLVFIGNPFTTPALFNTTTYWVISEDSGECPGGVAEVTVEVEPKPATPTVTGLTLCVGETGELTATFASVDNMDKVQWNDADNNVVAINDVEGDELPYTDILSVGPFTEPGVYEFTVFAFDSESVLGCTSDPVTVSVVVKPTPATPVAANTGPACEGDDVIFTASTIPGAVYNWNGPNGFSTTGQSFVLQDVTPFDAGTYTVYVTIDGCESEVASTELLVDPKPGIEGGVSSNSPVCEHQSIELFANYEGEGDVSYQWTGPNGFSSTEANPVIEDAIVELHQGFYTLVITDQETGCESQAYSTLVIVNKLPDGIIATNNGPVCEGGSVTLNVSNIFGATYSWTGPDGFESDERSPVIENVTMANEGIYQVVVTLNGCASEAATTFVDVRPNPIANAGPDVTIIVGQSAVLEGSGGIIYQWSPSDWLNDDGASKPVVTPPTPGEYVYVLTVYNEFGCSDQDTVVVTVLPTDNPIIPDLITPNGDGFNDFWEIPQHFLDNIGRYTLSIYARGGVKVFETTQYANDWQGLLDGDKLPDGPYWWVIQTEDRVYKGAVTIKR